MSEFLIKRIYDPAAARDGYRILVDRRWPHGVSKERATLDLWLKDIAPSPELRKGWCHIPSTVHEFADLYQAEFDDNPAVASFLALRVQYPVFTLFYGAKDPVINHAVVLRDFLLEQPAE